MTAKGQFYLLISRSIVMTACVSGWFWSRIMNIVTTTDGLIHLVSHGIIMTRNGWFHLLISLSIVMTAIVSAWFWSQIINISIVMTTDSQFYLINLGSLLQSYQSRGFYVVKHVGAFQRWNWQNLRFSWWSETLLASLNGTQLLTPLHHPH